MRKLRDFTCQLCPRVKKCKTLCPPMAWYANQDIVDPGKEKTIAPESLGFRKYPGWPENLSTTEIIFLMYFVDKMKQPEIAKTLYISHQYVSKIIIKYKKIVIENLKKQVASAS